MTVCVAAICNNRTIFGASDRMLTAGDIQFEPPQEKIIALTTSIAALLAGDSALQSEIMHFVKASIAKRITERPDDWLGVDNVAQLCALQYRRQRQRRTESAILAPLGLDNNTFLSRQRELEPQLLAQIARDLVNYELPRVQTIVAGVDPSGPHIYIVSDGQVFCQDTVGFAAIGAGSWHADSQFMFAVHATGKPLADTLLLTYAAKKRAEVAPGVGKATDMFGIGPGLGTFAPVPAGILENLERIYKKTRDKTAQAIEESNTEVNAYVQELIAAATPEPQAAGQGELATAETVPEEVLIAPEPPESEKIN